MKIVQTLWTLPGLQQKSDKKTLQNRLNGGWLKPKYYYFALAYSCLSIKKFYPHIELITDNFGADLLINKLNLPYTKVSLLPDSINDLPTGLWAYPKIYSYSIQEEPFIHIDNDVFLWNKFPDKIENSELIVQNYEKLTTDYDIALDFMMDNFTDLPSYIKRGNEYNKYNYQSINAGIFGGNDIKFIKFYTNEAFKFINNNLLNIKKSPHKTGVLNVVFEQLTFFQLAKIKNKQIDTLFNKSFYENMVNMLRFEMVPIEYYYIHCLGELKKNEIFCKQIEFRLCNEYPETYAKIANLLNLKDIQFNNDFKRFEKIQNEFKICKNRKDLLKLRLTLDKRIILREKDGCFFIKDKKEFKELSGWNKYLMFFMGKNISGQQLIDKIIESKVGEIFSKRDIEDNILALVTQNIVLNNRLLIV